MIDYDAIVNTRAPSQSANDCRFGYGVRSESEGERGYFFGAKSIK